MTTLAARTTGSTLTPLPTRAPMMITTRAITMAANLDDVATCCRYVFTVG
jgi:hypothetical protein